MFPRHSRPEPDPQPAIRVPDTPAEAVYVAAIADARLALHVAIARLPVGSPLRDRLVEVLSGLSDVLIMAEMS